jgi:hypothetical protein
MTHRYVLCEQRRLLQWLSLSSSVFQSYPLLVALPAAFGRSDTAKAYFLLEFVGIGVPCSTAVLIILNLSTDSQTFSLVVRESAVSPSAK